MRLREASASDVAAIVALLADDPLAQSRERPGDPVYAAAFAAMAAQPGNTILIAEDPSSGAILGCLQLTLIHGLSRGGMTRAQIEGVRVSRTRRGAGIGRRLMEEAIVRARTAGCGLVQLTTDRGRPEALAFYETLGFIDSHRGLKLPLT